MTLLTIANFLNQKTTSEGIVTDRIKKNYS